MTIRSSSRSRARIRTTRRLSPCYRHPDEPLTGICPSCLRERLSGLDAFSTADSTTPELRRCRSVVSVSKCESSSRSFHEPRRKSCDVVSSRSSLSNLFDMHDVKAVSDADVKVETKNLGLSRVTYTVVESKDHLEETRLSVDKRRVLNTDIVDSDEDIEEGEFRTMKEYIDLEFQNKSKKSKDLREIAGSFWGAASVFSKKLRKLGQKSNITKLKKLSSGSNEKGIDGGHRNLKLFENRQRFEQNRTEIVGRRSCDTEPRFSVDGGRISFEEPRASWDGYMIARTIPRLAPMFSTIENVILENVNNNRFENHRLSIDGPMHAIMEDDSSSRGSGNSHSDSSSSMRGSSLDRSSSVKSSGKKILSSEDHVLSPANVKLVITEKELKDWHLTSSRGEGLKKIESVSRDTAAVNTSNVNVPAKKSVRWRKVCNVFGFKPKCSENKPEAFKGNAVDPSIDDINEKQGKEAGEDLKDFNGWKLARSSSVVGSRTSCDAVASSYRRRSFDSAGAWGFKREGFTPANGSSKELEDGMTPFYLTPLRSLRRCKSGKFKLQNSHCIAGNLLQLN